MKKLALLVIMLAAPVLWAVNKPLPPTEDYGSRRNFTPRLGATDNPDGGYLVYHFLADAGEVAPITDLCTTYAADITGLNAWCLRPDGGAVGEVLTPAGTIALETMPVCGNGASCGSETRERFATTGEIATGVVASPLDALTCCSVFTPDTLAAQRLVDKITTTNVANLNMTVNGAINWTAYKVAGSTSLTSSNSLVVARTRNIACGRYDFVTDGTSISNIWLNGAQAAGSSSSTAAVGPLTVAVTPWLVHAAASAVTGTVSNAFCVPAYLDDTKMAAIAKSAIGATITPTLGAVPTITRSTQKYCPVSGEATASFMAINRGCFTGGKYMASRGGLSRIIRTEEFDNATWTKISDGVTAIPVVTANTTDVLDPYGTNTAEKVEFPAVSGVNTYSLLRQTWAGGAATTAASAIWGRTASGTATLYQGFSIATPTYHSKACTFTTTWSRCHMDTKAVTNATWNYDLGVNLVDPGQAAQAASTVYLWGASVERTTNVVMEYQTCGASCTTQEDEITIATNPVSGATHPICISADIEPLDPAGTWTDIGTTSAGGTVLSMGPTVFGANYVFLEFRRDNVPACLRLYHYNNVAALVGLAGTDLTECLNTGEHTVLGKYGPGPVAGYKDGALIQNTTNVSTGTASYGAYGATMGIGMDGTAGRSLHGYISNLKIGTGPRACDP